MVSFFAQPSPPGFISKSYWSSNPFYGSFSSAVAGTGAVIKTPMKGSVATSTDASSTALQRTTDDSGWFRDSANTLNFDKKIVLAIRLTMIAGTTNGVARITLGKAEGTGVGALALEGIGIQIANLAVSGLAHDGTDLTTTDLSTTLTANATVDILIKSDGNGGVVYLINDVEVGSNTGGPTGAASAGNSVFQWEVENNADTANQQLVLHNHNIYTEP